MGKDNLGKRMKENYENRTRFYLPRRTYSIIRVDGKAFHTYTKGCTKPFDDNLIEDMNNTAIFLCEQIQGSKFAYVQSDEITILMTDFDQIDTCAWFDGNIQKIVSVSASLATARFNELRFKRGISKLAMFDSRVFTISSRTEVYNNFVWRIKDWERNSITAVAQSLYSHKELMNKSCNQMQEMIWQKGINWNDYASQYKRGRFIYKISEYDNLDPSKELVPAVQKRYWSVIDLPIITQEPEWLLSKIPILD